MKFARLLFILFIVSAILAGCQAGVKPPPAAATESPSANEPYPQPAPVETSAVESSSAPASSADVYPELKDGDEVDWSKVVGIIMSGQVSKVAQTHDLKVYLTLKDGRTIVSVEPVIDELMGLIDYCGDPCKDILVATE